MYAFRFLRNVCNSSLSLKVRKMSQKLTVADRFKNQPPSIWVTINEIIAKKNPVNLGQGFPDFAAPPHVINALQNVVNSDNFMIHQYTRAFGHPRLVKALSDLYSPLNDRQIDPLKEILVSVGAYSSLFTIINAFVNPGDEVVIVEPFFDCYEPMVRGVQGIPVFVPLKPSGVTGPNGELNSSNWSIDPEELRSKFNSKTKLLMINSPNNPMGKMYSREELQLFADLCKEHDVICVSDEVYEWITYEPNKHIKIGEKGLW